MGDFESLIEEQTFDDLIEKVPRVDETKVTSSLGQKPQEISMQMQMQGPTASKYGMDFDPNMYISDELPALATLEDPTDVKAQDEVKEKVHQDYFMNEEAQRVIDATAKRQPTISQGPAVQLPPKIDPELLQPGAAEYLIDKLSNESLLGKASILLTGTILSGIHGGDPLEYYRDIYDANNQTIMSYKPNELQDMATGSLGVIVDLPIFQGIGALYNSASANSIKYATSYVSDSMVKGGLTRNLADNYAKNSVIRLNSMLQTGTILGTHAGLNDIATQLADGAELGEVNWNQALNTTAKSGQLGFSVGAFGVGANYFRSTSAFQKVIDGSVKGRLIEKGFGAAALGGEVSIFTYGDALLSGKKLSSVTGKEWIHGATTIGSLKAMHARVRLPSGKGNFNAVELDAIKKHTKNFSHKEPLRSMVEDPIAGEKLLNDPKVPFSTKAKIADMAGVEYTMPLVAKVKMITNAEGTRVETRTKDGMLVQSDRFASESEALRTMNMLETGIAEMDKVSEMTRMTPENKIDMDRRLEKAGIEKGIANEELMNAVQQLPSQRTAEQKKMANTAFETYDALKIEKTEVVEGETPQKFFVEEKSVEVEPPIDAAKIIEAAKEKAFLESRAKEEVEPKAKEELSTEQESKILDRFGILEHRGVRRASNYSFKPHYYYRSGESHLKVDVGGYDNVMKSFERMKEMNKVLKNPTLQATIDHIQQGVDVYKEIIDRIPKNTKNREAKVEQLKDAIKVAGDNKETFAEAVKDVFKAGTDARKAVLDAYSKGLKEEILQSRSLRVIKESINKTADALTDQYFTKEGRGVDIKDLQKPIESKIVKELKPKEEVKPKTGEQTAESLKATAEKIRALKGAVGPKPGELGVSIIPPVVFDTAVEIAARAFETTGDAVLAVGRAIDSMKSTTTYRGLSGIEKERWEREMRGKLNDTFDVPPVKPPKTAKQTKIDKDITRPKNKVTVSEYTALKDQIRTQAKVAKDIDKFRKEAQADIQKVIGGKDFQTAMGARTSRTIARKVAGMDVNNPGSVVEVTDYIDRAITDAKFREELANIDKAYGKLDAKTDPSSYSGKDKATGVLKGKGIDPAYQDKLASTRKNILEADGKEAQLEIDKLQTELEAMNPGDPLIDPILDRIEDLSFHGLLNKTTQPTLDYLNSRIADVDAIRKQGRTLGAAKRFVNAAERAEKIQGSFDVLNAGKRKVQLDPEKAANLKVPYHKKVSRWLDWSNLDSWFTLTDKMSRFDKSSSMFQSYLSKSASEPIFTSERNEFLGRTERQNIANDKLSEIYDTEKPRQLKKILDKNTTDLHKMKWKSKDPVTGKEKAEDLDITMNQAYKRWMELQDPSLKPSLTKQGYFDQLGERTGKYDALENVMTPEIKKWADWQLNEFYPKYAESINEVYREIYGTDMPINDKYSPIFVADKMISADAAIDQMFSSNDFRGMAGNSHLKLRTKHAKELLLLDGDKVMMNYINKMEFFKNWAGTLRDMNSVFGDRSIRESIRQNFGEDYITAVDHFMKKAARDPVTIQKFEQWSNKIRKNFTVASLAIKPTVFTKQLTSFPAYADKIPTKNFVAGIADWANPAGWNKITKLLNDSPYIQERYQKGWDRDVALAMRQDAQSMLAGKKGNNSNSWMFLTKYGDKGAIMLGGWPVYKYHRNKALKDGLSPEDAHQQGLREFEFATRQSQQATGPMDLSVLQNSNQIMKWATMYKTSPLQYHRKVVTAARDLAFDGRNRKESLKTLLIYHAVLPQLFQLVSNGFQWDGEDQLRALKWGSTTGVPVVGDALRGIANHISNTGFEYRPTVLTDIFKQSAKAIDELDALIDGGLGPLDDITFDDIWESIDKLAKAGGSLSGTGTDAIHNTVEGVADAIQGETNFPARRILGWSEYALDDDRYDLLRDFPEDAMAAANKVLGNEKKSWDSLLEDQGNPETFDDLIEK